MNIFTIYMHNRQITSTLKKTIKSCADVFKASSRVRFSHDTKVFRYFCCIYQEIKCVGVSGIIRNPERHVNLTT